jgi:uncharacterized protein (DUF433 family)
MSNRSATFKGIVHGNSIRLEGEPGIPDGQEVTVVVQPYLTPEEASERLPPEEGIRRSSGARADEQGGRSATPEDVPGVELWADRLVFDSSVSTHGRVVKGTRFAAEDLIAEIEQGRSDEAILRAHPELTSEDIAALRAFARVPLGFRLSFGAWAGDGDELDRYIESVYERRRTQQRRPIE